MHNFTIPLDKYPVYVIDENGDPIGDVKVETQLQIVFGDFELRHSTYSQKTDEFGMLDLYFHSGSTYNIDAELESSSLYAPLALGGYLVDEQSTITLVMKRAKKLYGYVDIEGIGPTENIEIQLYNAGTYTFLTEGVTDPSGYYETYVSDDSVFDIYISYTDYSNIGGMRLLPNLFGWEDYRTELNITTDTQLDFSLSRFTLSGRTTDSNGVPIAGVGFFMEEDFYPGFFLTNYIHQDYNYTEADGYFSLAVMYGGPYDLTVYPPAGSGFAIISLGDFVIENSIQQNFILNLPDTTDPLIIGGPVVNEITHASAIVEWKTNELADSVVTYGTDNPPTQFTTTLSDDVIDHVVPLNGLALNTTYYARVSSTDDSGNGPVASGVIEFTTLATADTQPPVILEGPIVEANSCTGDTVVEWTTNEPATTHVAYNPDPASLTTTTLTIPGLRLQHRVELTDLTPGLEYTLIVYSGDAFGNGPIPSHQIQFIAPEPAGDNTPPVYAGGPVVVHVTDTRATIEWTTNEPATSGISYNDGISYAIYFDDNPVIEHSVTLEGLTPDSTYEFTVAAKDACGNGPALSPTKSFTTLPAADAHAPHILAGPVAWPVTAKSALIGWVTDEPADSVVEYGTDATLGTTRTQIALRHLHTVPLVGLTPDTEYFYRVRSTDRAGNAVAGDLMTLRTRPLAPARPLSIIDGPAIAYNRNGRVLIVWKTNQPADTTVRYGIGSELNMRRTIARKTRTHAMLLTGLTAGQNYTFQVVSTDLEGQTATSYPNLLAKGGGGKAAGAATFVASGAPDSVPPVIDPAPAVSGITGIAAIVDWTTDEPADTSVAWRVSGSGTAFQITGSAALTGEHQGVLTNLQASTLYEFEVSSTDPSGNTTTAAGSFTTAATADSTGPVFVIEPTGSTSGTGELQLSWTTDEPASANLMWGLAPGNLDQLDAILDLDTTQSLALAGLSQSVTYYGQVTARDATGNQTVGSMFTFVLGGLPGGGQVVGSLPFAVEFIEGSGLEVDVEKGGSATTQTVTIRNVGTDNLTVFGLLIAGDAQLDFALASAPGLPVVLAPGESIEVTLRFDPQQLARTLGLSAVLRVLSDDPADPSYDIPLAGDAVPVEIGEFLLE